MKKQDYINLYGERNGLIRWKRGGSLEAYIEKYGYNIGTEKYNERRLRQKGKGSLNHYIKKYGEINGLKKYKEKNLKLSVNLEKLKEKFGEKRALEIKQIHLKKSINSLENFISRHGEIKGTIKYEQYISKINESNIRCKEYWIKKGFSEQESKELISSYQSRSINTFIEKYGEIDGVEKYKKYCASKGHGLENCIEKFGEEIGKNVYDLWKNDRQGMGSLNYYINKLGLKDGTEKYKNICKLKTLSEEKFVDIYGEIGRSIYHEMVIRRTASIKSNSSTPEIELAKLLSEKFNDKDIRFGENQFIIGLNREEAEIFNSRCFKPDIVFIKEKIIVEFYGDIFHANPYKFKENDKPNPWLNKTSKEIREYDLIRENYFKSKGYKVFIVWESNWRKNKIETLNNLLKEINI